MDRPFHFLTTIITSIIIKIVNILTTLITSIIIIMVNIPTILSIGIIIIIINIFIRIRSFIALITASSDRASRQNHYCPTPSSKTASSTYPFDDDDNNGCICLTFLHCVFSNNKRLLSNNKD